MTEAYLSTIWYRVASLQPRLRAHIRTRRHRYRGRAWYVIHDLATGRVHRFTPAAYLLIGQMDGIRTLDEIWQGLGAARDAEAPSQDDVIRLMSQLHQNDLIQYQGSPDVADLLERFNKQAGQVLWQNLTNPMSFRLPIWDPDAFLTRSLPFVRFLFGWFGLLVWAAVVAAGLAVAALNWDRLTTGLADQLLATRNILITLITYPLLKALHELAHGWLIKKHGGEVREMGVMFLVFFPVPYVDASASAALPSKWHRAAVAAGGILVETFVAALAVIVWANAETGFVTAIAYNLVMIGGLSTLVVNGNPLLKFDGYYVLSDLLEIPNLAPRATKFWGHLVERYAFNARQLREETATWGERAWFVAYAPAAYVYRIIVMVGIAVFLARSYFVLGVLLAIWTVFQSLIKPVVKHLRHVATAPRLRKVRKRAVGLAYGGLAAVGLALALVPLPLHTETEGVVWLPDQAYVRAHSPGFVAEVTPARGDAVPASARLARLTDPTQDARIAALLARVEEFRRRTAALETRDRAEAEIARLQLAEAQGELTRELTRSADLTLYAPLSGTFEPLLPPEALQDRYLNEGDLLGYVLPPRPDRVRIVVRQDDIALVRGRVRGVDVALAGHLDRRHRSGLIREVPSAQNTLPSAALGQTGGGRFLTDPADRDGTRTLQPLFVFDLGLPDTMGTAPYGARVLVRFDHGFEPALFQGWRRLSQLFLRLVNA